MSFKSLEDFRKLQEAIKFCDDQDILCEDCPLLNLDDCHEYIEQGKRDAIEIAIKYLEKQEKRKRKHG